jgi:hypothetical protein
MAEAREAGNFALPDFARARPRRVLPVLGDGDARTDAAAGSSSKYAAENRVGFDRLIIDISIRSRMAET